MLAAYARNGVPEYWIVDVAEDVLEVYRMPAGDAYQSKRVVRRGDTVTPLHAAGSALPVDDLLLKR